MGRKKAISAFVKVLAVVSMAGGFYLFSNSPSCFVAYFISCRYFAIYYYLYSDASISIMKEKEA